MERLRVGRFLSGSSTCIRLQATLGVVTFARGTCIGAESFAPRDDCLRPAAGALVFYDHKAQFTPTGSTEHTVPACLPAVLRCRVECDDCWTERLGLRTG